MMVEMELMVIYEACQRGASWEIMGLMNNARMPSSQGYGAQDEQCERSAWLRIEALSIRYFSGEASIWLVSISACFRSY
jgi:hypothetical protein